MDRRLKRVFVIVLDSMGMGAMADAARFGDEGADTLGHISQTGKKMRQKNYRNPGGKRNKDFRGTRRAGNQGRKADRVHIGRFGSADLRERGDDGIRDPVSLL